MRGIAVNRRRKLALAVLVTGWIWVGCLQNPFTGAQVTVDLLTDIDANTLVRMPDGSPTHYELWAEFDDYGVVSIGKFVVDSLGHVLDYPDTEVRIGSVTGADDLRRSGVRWTSTTDLTDASVAFVTAEPNGETDISPSGYVIMDGRLTSNKEGELRGTMTGQYTNILGEERNPVSRITIIIAEDNVSF